MTTPRPPKVTLTRTASPGRPAWTAWAWIAGICLAVVIVPYVLFVEAPPPKKIVIATGGKAGAYYHYAQKYAAELGKERLTLEVRETKGSVENLALLVDDGSGVDIAIVQGGVATADDRERLVALGSLYREPLWVFYRGDAVLERLSQLAGKRINVGPPGSGTHAIALQLLAANGLLGGAGGSEGARATLVTDSVTAAAAALLQGDIDAAFFVAAFEADYVKELLNHAQIRVLSFGQHEAYHRRFRFLSEVTVPAGLVNLGQNLPREDIALVAPTALLVARKDLHPALVPLLLTAAARVHRAGDELSKPGEFPSAAFTDFPVSEDAQHFYKSGPPVLQRLLPFWLASLVDRLKVMLIPLLVFLMPVLRAAPPLARWRTRRKIYTWYAALREIDRKLLTGLAGVQLDEEIAALRVIDHNISYVEVPLSYMEELYHLRLHVTMMQERLKNLRAAQQEAPAKLLG